MRSTIEMAAPHDAADAGVAEDAISPGWFEAPLCRNCDAPLTTPYCAGCGQKAARRLSLKDFGKEGWERIRLFEKSSVKTLWRLVTSPGLVARDYVRGKRAAYMHPLKLLVALVAILLLILAANQYFERFAFAGQSRDVDLMAQRVMAYANWSFTLGIFAIFLGSRVGFGRRLHYNAIEHGVLAVYCQNLILAVVILNLLPTLIWHTPRFILLHKQASAYYLYAIKLSIVAIAYSQFFRLRLARDWPRLILACLVYAIASWSLLRLYAAAILWIVNRTA
ncbi:DUF3667 domain-containing protein [Sphingomonas crusticola]|uniref:DUF3667 domain-containing protein n=1 Tax=Sphingomonas crusticola TaxID=1697973 RepID=UPI0013C33460|nr:DUF3667 domain-containing protein [Sphingomonas crusticola]